MILVPRSTIWPGVLPTGSTGQIRPILATNRPYLTVHYTGAGVWLDPDDSPTELKAIQRYAQAAGKPWEYNYVVDGQGIVFEYAGRYRAAHCTGYNDLAIGVLLLVGLSGPGLTGFEALTAEMVASVRELRAWLVAKSYLAVDHQMLQHRQMPAANTLCPGPEVDKQWAAMTVPMAEEDDVPEVFYSNADERTWAGGTYPPRQIKYKLLETGKCRRISGDELADRGHPDVTLEFGIPKPNSVLDSIEVTP